MNASIETPDTESAHRLADLWVELARDQRSSRSHLLAEPNRERVREAMVRHIIAGTVRVAERKDGIVGFVTFGGESESYEQDVQRGFIYNLYVREADRNLGIGSALLESAEAALDERGFDIIALQVMAPNENARRFYRRHGYEPQRIELEKPI
ncbi:MAG: GNAT family N-acetyltransferase [Natronomonas sp.]